MIRRQLATPTLLGTLSRRLAAPVAAPPCLAPPATSLRSLRTIITTTQPARAAARMKESEIKRNPHPDFKAVEASRPAWDRDASFHFTQAPKPDWTPGSGANDLSSSSTSSSSQEAEAEARKKKKHIPIDPHAEGRAPVSNYKLLISGVVPRPIAFVSTRSADGRTTNLAPFSYFQMVNHDPPLLVIGFTGSLEAAARAKHSLHNLHATGECTINLIAEHYVEAANAASTNAPYGVSEWALSGLTPVYDCETVAPARVGEAIFSIEGKLDFVREFQSRSRPGQVSGTMAVIEGTRFWVREDAINETRDLIDPAVLKPISRLGGITYGRTTEAFELLRPDFEKDLGGMATYEKLEAERGGVDDKTATKGGDGDGKV